MKITCGKVCYPWVMIGEFEDGYSYEMGGNDIGDCLSRLEKLEAKHGEMTWYGGLNDEGYVDGEYIGPDCSTNSCKAIGASDEVRTYRNKRNENKYLETKKYKDGHTVHRGYMKWDTPRGEVKNYMGSKSNRGRWFRTNKNTLNDIVQDDYEEITSSTSVDSIVDKYYDRVSWDELCDIVGYDGPEEGPSTDENYELDHVAWLCAKDKYFRPLSYDGHDIAELVSENGREFIAVQEADRVFDITEEVDRIDSDDLIEDDYD